MFMLAVIGMLCAPLTALKAESLEKSPPGIDETIIGFKAADFIIEAVPAVIDFEITAVCAPMEFEPATVLEVSEVAECLKPNRLDRLLIRGQGFTHYFYTEINRNHIKKPVKERGVSPGTCRIAGINSSHCGKMISLRSSLHLRPDK